jgi:hypothetical protein
MIVPLPEIKEIPKILLLLTLSLHEDALLVHLSPQREREVRREGGREGGRGAVSGEREREKTPNQNPKPKP